MASDNLKINMEKDDGKIVCHIKGEISYETVEELRGHFAELRQSTREKIILDLAKLTVLGSAGLGEMARLILWGEANKFQIKIVAHDDHIKEVLEISGLDKYAPVYPTLSEAMG